MFISAIQEASSTIRSEYQVTHSFPRNSIVLLMTHPINISNSFVPF